MAVQQATKSGRFGKAASKAKPVVGLKSDGERALASRSSKVARWGNSLGVRIPIEGVSQLKLKDGESVRVDVNADTIVISRARPRKRYTENELLRGITPEIAGPDLIPDRAGKELI